MIDPFESTSRLLSDIAGSYRQQGNQRKDREADAAKVKKDELRYQDQINRQQTSDKRQALLDQRQTDIYNKNLAREKAEIDALSNLDMYNRENAVKAALASDTELQTTLNEGKAEGAKTLANNFFIDQINNSNELAAMRSMAGDDGEDFSPTQADLPKDPLAAIEQYYKTGEISKEQYSNFQQQLSKFNEDFDNYVVSNKPLYREKQNSAIYKDLVSKGVSSSVAAATADRLTQGYDSKADLTKSAIAAQKAQQQNYNKLADISFKVWNANKSKANKFSDKKTTEVDVISYIENEIDAGPYDNQQLLNAYKGAVAAGVNPSIAKNSLKDFVAVDWQGKELKGSVDNFTSFAKGIQKLENSDGTLTRDELISSFMPKAATTPDYVNVNRSAFTGGLRDLMPQALGFPIRVPTRSADVDSDYPSSGTSPSPAPISREVVLTPAEITKTRQEAVQEGKNPDNAVANALELKNILLSLEPKKPDSSTSLSDLSVRTNSGRDPLSNLYDFAEIAGNTDLSIQGNIDALNMAYGAKEPLTKDRIEKIVADVKSGNINPVLADGSEYPLPLPSEEEGALTMSTPILNAVGGYTASKVAFNALKNAPRLANQFIGGLRQKVNAAARNRAIAARNRSFNRTGANTTGNTPYGPPTPAQAAARANKQSDLAADVPAILRKSSAPAYGPPTRAQSLASGNIR